MAITNFDPNKVRSCQSTAPLSTFFTIDADDDIFISSTGYYDVVAGAEEYILCTRAIMVDTDGVYSLGFAGNYTSGLEPDEPINSAAITLKAGVLYPFQIIALLGTPPGTVYGFF